MTTPNWFDDILGQFDILDKIEAWVSFALAPKSKRARHSRTDLVTCYLPHNPDVSLNELIDHLSRWGINAKRSGFDSGGTYYQIRRNQWDWHNARVQVDGDTVRLLGNAAHSW